MNKQNYLLINLFISITIGRLKIYFFLLKNASKQNSNLNLKKINFTHKNFY